MTVRNVVGSFAKLKSIWLVKAEFLGKNSVNPLVTLIALSSDTCSMSVKKVVMFVTVSTKPEGNDPGSRKN